MGLMIKNVLIPNGESSKRIDILIDGVKIEKVGILNEGSMPVIDASQLTALPGFIDLHTHGGQGVDINFADEEGIRQLCRFYASSGVSGFLPTVLTDSVENTLRAINCIKNVAASEYSGARILGIHLEGPFLCMEYKGAQPEEYIVEGTIENFKVYEEAAQGLIKYMTVAIENSENIGELIEYAANKGIIVSLGHTGGDYDKCMYCIEKGAKSITHTFNAMAPLHQHRPSILGAALESDAVSCEFICDGFHLHPGIVRLILKVKGIDRVIAVTDSVMAAGLPDGPYKLGVNDIVVKNGDAMLADGSARAGSTLTMIKAMKNLKSFTSLNTEDLIKPLSSNPARLLGLGDKKGSLNIGYDADIILVDEDNNIEYMIIQGEVEYKRR